MAASAGRLLLVKKAGTTIAAVRAKTISVENTPIDITSDDSGGIVTLLSGVNASRQLKLSVSGVASDTTLRAAAFSTSAGGPHLTDITIVDPVESSGADTITCDWYVTKYERSGEHDGEEQFSAELVSSGAWTLT